MANFGLIKVTVRKDGMRALIPVAGIMAVEEYKDGHAFVVTEIKRNRVIGVEVEESFLKIGMQLHTDYVQFELANGDSIVVRDDVIDAILEDENGKAAIRYKGLGHGLMLRNSFDYYADLFAERDD